jgi:hypothetical protein
MKPSSIRSGHRRSFLLVIWSVVLQAQVAYRPVAGPFPVARAPWPWCRATAASYCATVTTGVFKYDDANRRGTTRYTKVNALSDGQYSNNGLGWNRCAQRFWSMGYRNGNVDVLGNGVRCHELAGH